MYICMYGMKMYGYLLCELILLLTVFSDIYSVISVIDYKYFLQSSIEQKLEDTYYIN